MEKKTTMKLVDFSLPFNSALTYGKILQTFHSDEWTGIILFTQHSTSEFITCREVCTCKGNLGLKYEGFRKWMFNLPQALLKPC
jgi:hypothetical protein